MTYNLRAVISEIFEPLMNYFHRISHNNTHLQIGSRAGLLGRDVRAQEVFLRTGRMCRKLTVFLRIASAAK